VRILLVLFLAVPLSAQQHPPAWPTSPANCNVDGQVLDSVTSMPVAGAVVTIYNMRAYRVDGGIAIAGAGVQSPEQVPEEDPRSVTSGENGRFSFTGLEPGIYVMGAIKEGYLRSRYMTPNPAFGGTIQLEPGTDAHDLPIRLRPQSVLAGHILGAGGAPLAGARVGLGKLALGQEGRAMSIQASSVTDQHGEYRIEGIEPDEYYVRVEPPARRPAAGAGPRYMVAFYPGIETIGDAHPVKLSEGQHLDDLDMTLPQRPGASIQGIIAAADGATPSSVQVTSKEFGPLAGTVGRTDDGRFTFEVGGLSPGSYWLHARAVKPGRVYDAWKLVNLDWSGRGGIELRPAPSVDLHGHVEFDGPTGRSITKLALYLDNSYSVGNGRLWIHVQDDGRFTLNGVPAAVYRITPEWTDRGYLQAVRMGGIDVSETGLDLTQGDPSGDLELSFSTASGTVVGDVVDEKGNPAVGSMIALLPAVMPADPQRARALSRITATDRRGVYGFIGIPPGDYVLLAWRQAIFNLNAVLYDPDYLKRFEAQARAVQIGPNSKQTIQLQAIR
jgi:protocatechuate 3,4-dioxygenase beta subunit